MSDSDSTIRQTPGSTVGGKPNAKAAAAARLVSSLWEEGSLADLPAAVEAHPCLTTDRSLFLDLAQKEYRLRRDEWRDCSPEEYCQRFSGLDSNFLLTLHKLIEVEQCLGEIDFPDLIRLSQERDWPSEGDRFAEFLLLEELGRGALARCFLARQPNLGHREVVLKLTHAVQGEADVLGRLSHPNVVTVHAVGVDPATGLGWICMPYLGRRTLEHAIRDFYHPDDGSTPSTDSDVNEMRPRQHPREGHQQAVLGLFAGLANGLAYVHDHGLLHGDLKPSNILLTDQGVPMLIDFNLAQEAHAESRLAGGTLPYMAPEQLRGLTHDVHGVDSRTTIASEVFSFGAVLFQALTGVLPFDHGGEPSDLGNAATRLLAAQREWHASSRAAADVEPSVAGFVERCVALLPEDRPRSMRVVQQALDDLLASTASTAESVTRRALLAAGFAGAAALAVGAVGAGGWRREDLFREASDHAASNRHDQAIGLLTNVIQAEPDHLEARRLLGECLLNTGKPAKAADAFLAAWHRRREPIDIAMMAYCRNRNGEKEVAIYGYRTARDAGLSSPIIDHNEAASLVQKLWTDYDRDASRLAHKLLMRAWRQMRQDATVRLTIFRHHFVPARQKDSSHPAYPIEVAARSNLPRLNAGLCAWAAKFVGNVARDDDELRTQGLPWLRDLVAYYGPGELESRIGSDTYMRFAPLIANERLDSVQREGVPPSLPQYLSPSPKKNRPSLAAS